MATYDFDLDMATNLALDYTTDLHSMMIPDWIMNMDDMSASIPDSSILDSSTPSTSTSEDWVNNLDDGSNPPGHVANPNLTQTTPPPQAAPTSASTTSSPTHLTYEDGNGWVCDHPACKCGGRIFKWSSNLKKHLDRLTRPFPCDTCRVKPFTTACDLARHKREVHKIDPTGKSPRKLFCPIKACNRHRREFTRKDNLRSHIQRVHGPDWDEDDETIVQSAPQGSPRTGQATDGVRTHLEELQRQRGDIQRQREELQRQREELAGDLEKMDQQIEAVKTTLDSMEGSS